MTDRLSLVIEGFQALQDPSIAKTDPRNVRQIAYLLGAINACGEPESRSVLLSLLASEYAACELVQEEEQARRAAIFDWPHDPLNFIALAMHYSRRDRHEDAIRKAQRLSSAPRELEGTRATLCRGWRVA